MKKTLPFLMILIGLSSSGFAQVGIGTTVPHSSAMLHVESTTKGFLPPRMTSDQRTSIPNPKTGLMVFDTITQSYWLYRQEGWKEIMSSTSGWSLTGNSGTNPAINFLGTTDTSTLIFKVNNAKSGMLNYNKQLSAFGYNALLYNSGSDNTAIGFETLKMNSTGNNNTAIGSGALSLNTTGSNNTAIGNGTGFTGTSTGYTNTTVIGYQAKATDDNQVRLGNDDIETLYCMGAYTGEVSGSDYRVLHVDNTGKIGWLESSIRYKTGVMDMEDISWIYRLRPVNFTYKHDPSQSKKYGLIAEEVEEVNPSFVSHNSEGVAETVRYDELIAPIIKTLQDQQKTIARLEEQNALLIKRIEDLEKGK
jgi:hypothetical protein